MRPTRGALLSRIAELLGWELWDWQQLVADVALEYDALTRVPSYRTVGVSVARQNGKTTLVCARIAMQLIVPYATVVYTAQDRNLARFKWQEHVDRLMATPFAARVSRVDKVNGREQLLMTNGARYLIVTPGERAGRGLTIDLAVIDEAFAQEDMRVVGALAPAMSARRSAQLWLLSNAGTQRSALWRHYTDIGRASIESASSTTCWVEWAADDADGVNVEDRSAWLAANPTLDLAGGVSSSALADAAQTLDLSTFAREHLNLWAELTLLMGIDPVTWAACRDDAASPGTTDLALSIDITPERDRGAVVACGLVEGRAVIEVVETSSDLHRLAERALQVAHDWHCTVVLDRGSPASSLLPLFERADVPVRLLSLPDFARACADLHDAVVRHTIAHRGDWRLTDAVAAATKRPVGDAWVWRRRGSADITPLVAATLARWGVVAAPVELRPVVF
jgi:phage terminase large subunit-like protein